MRVGIGYDLHRMVLDRPLILGGVLIPFECGPIGHSDGDVLTHAIADAILGAAGLGDIGQWFPPDDDSYKNAKSIDLLSQINNEIKRLAYRIENIDSVLICERPRLSPHYKLMQQALSDCLGIDKNAISIKSKTNERLGEIGAGDAIAAHAVVLLSS